MLASGVFLSDRYEILEKVGSGGMSDVYKAKCHKLNRFVAIKVLKHEFSSDKSFVSKFSVEAQSAAGLSHPNIVNIYDVGEDDGRYYIVMELVEGITLKNYIEKKGRLEVKEAVSITIQILQGIQAAHNHHIIHRDIKPQNIIISKEGKVKVTEFLQIKPLAPMQWVRFITFLLNKQEEGIVMKEAISILWVFLCMKWLREPFRFKVTQR